MQENGGNQQREEQKREFTIRVIYDDEGNIIFDNSHIEENEQDANIDPNLDHGLERQRVRLWLSNEKTG